VVPNWGYGEQDLSIYFSIRNMKRQQETNLREEGGLVVVDFTTSALCSSETVIVWKVQRKLHSVELDRGAQLIRAGVGSGIGALCHSVR
jgi:hypothetical protein